MAGGDWDMEVCSKMSVWSVRATIKRYRYQYPDVVFPTTIIHEIVEMVGFISCEPSVNEQNTCVCGISCNLETLHRTFHTGTDCLDCERSCLLLVRAIRNQFPTMRFNNAGGML